MKGRIVLLALVVFLTTAINLPAQLTVLHNFSGSDGANPAVGMVLATDGNFYGTTYTGGNINAGTAFKITPSGTLTTLYNFCQQQYCGDGAQPMQIIQGRDGNFYGVTISGGNGETGGVIFKLTPSGSESVPAKFCNPTYGCGSGPQVGSNPTSLMQANDGNFYGVTSDAGFGSTGGLWQLVANGWGFTSLYIFSSTYGVNPSVTLVQGADGQLYGVAYYGGNGLPDCASSCGTVFKLTLSGNPTLLHSFCLQTNCADGAEPTAALVRGSDGNFYGTTSAGGANYAGVIFKVTPNGTYTILHSFAAAGEGNSVVAPLIQASDGNFYGTASGGGAYGDGTIFEITPGGTFTVLHSFSGSDGATPWGALVQNSQGNFYGTTYSGGANNLGTVFVFTPPPLYTLSVSKNGSGTVTSSDNDINCGATCSYQYLAGTQVTLTATPNSGWVFTSWSGCDNVNGNVCTVTMNNNRNVTATFTDTYQLTVSKTGNGTITSGDGHINCGSTCSYTYVNGTVVTLTASPAQNWVFTSWSGCDNVNANVCTVTMNSPRNVTATFTATYQLTVSKTGNGTVTSGDNHINCGSTCSYVYLTGTVVTLTASPGSGWGFAGWTGCDISNLNVCTVVMNNNRTVTATFKVLYALSVSKTGNGSVSSVDGHIYCGSVCSYLYMDGTQVMLSAVPAAGDTFTGWTGCDNVNGSYCSVTVSSVRNVTAAFSSINNILLTSLTFKPSYVREGQLSAGTLTLSGSAPPGGLGVALSSDHPGVAHPPSFVLVPGGKASVQFAVQTFPVKSNTTVTITATSGMSHVSGTLIVGTTSLPPSAK